MTRRAVIVGGGVAGPVAAMALHRAGWKSTVYEAHPTSAADVGAFLTFAVNGMDALRAIDAQRAVGECGFSTPTLEFQSGTGKLLGTVPLGGNLSDGTVTRTIKRADLYRAMHDEAVRRGVGIEYGKRLVRAESVGSGVRAYFADGTSTDGDVLIGCDGIHSVVRSIIDPAAPAPRYVPVLNTGGYARGVDTTGLAPTGVFRMMFGKRVFFAYAVHPDGDVWWFANPPRRREPDRAELAAITDAQWRAELHELLADDAGPWHDIVDATPAELTAWPTYDLPNVPVWYRDSMVVIGDAAHATSPAAGQGASLAIEDAVLLAMCLRDHDRVGRAFAAFDGMRRSRVERIVAAGARNSNSKAAGPLGRVLRDAFLPHYLRRLATGDPKVAFMYDHHIDWSSRVA